MTDATLDPYLLATCSYRALHPDMGVPVGTSIGTNKRFPGLPQAEALKPYGVFRRLDHLPLDQRIAAYHDRLDRRERQVRDNLDELVAHYGHDQRFVLLCWCHLPDADTGPRGCHRRWAAEWFASRWDLTVPEYGPIPREQPGDGTEQATLI